MKRSPIACSFELTNIANGYIQLFPFGRFYPADKRPEGVEGWYVDDSNGEMLATQINHAQVRLMIDYEHQTLFIAQNGQGNPAAGWITRAEYRSGEGLFAEVEWTEKAREHIKAKEYRYISPYFLPADDGQVLKLINAALTNRPALHQLAEAVATSAHTQQDFPMLEILKKLFGLPNGTEADITDKLTALSAAKGENGVALSEVYAELDKAQKAVEEAKAVALSAQDNPDPTKFVALSEMKQVQDQLTALQAQVQGDKVEQMVAVALSEGKLLPSQKEWAVKLGKQNLVALSDYLSVAVANPALNGTQSGGKDPNTDKGVALSAEQVVAAKALGMTEVEYAALIKEDK
ncbi:hypothetical protein A4G19_03725 [Pasteurellaceae bacterium Macca]|nr:hypothetical protein [Pasteurellaceae bacterium Macca]